MPQSSDGPEAVGDGVVGARSAEVCFHAGVENFSPLFL